jgi:hypothetical protein
MAEAPNTAAQINAQFLEWLQSMPELFGKFLEIAKEWYRLQNTAPGAVKPAAGPEHFQIGGTVTIQTGGGISDEDINAVYQGYAEAIQKEKAIEYIKGFIAGFMMRGA